jgi:hypothetical protein
VLARLHAAVGLPIENAYVEGVNGQFRDECLNEHWFVSLADADQAICDFLSGPATPAKETTRANRLRSSPTDR